MKVLVLSDVHSNIFALEAIWTHEQTADMILCAGDLVDYGTHPLETLSWLIDHKAICVLGNHDQCLIETYKNGRFSEKFIPPQDFKWVHHNCNNLTPDSVDYLENLPISVSLTFDGFFYIMRHHSLMGYNTVESLMQFETLWQQLKKPDIQNDQDKPRRFIFGHTHLQRLNHLSPFCEWLNPGSASYRRPHDPDKNAHYAIIQDGNIQLKTVPYDRVSPFHIVEQLIVNKAMMQTELQDAAFFFGNALTTRDPLPEIEVLQ